MSTVFQKPSWTSRLKQELIAYDLMLFGCFVALLAISSVAGYSAAYDFPGRFDNHVRNMSIAIAMVIIVAQVPPQKLMQVAVPIFVVGVALLIAVALFGIVKKGSRRWVNIGVVIQPSEIMKIAMPLMLGWWFQKREGSLRALDFAVAAVILAVPTLLVARQPDLGTALLVFASGAVVIYFAGLKWRVLFGLIAAALAAIPLWWNYLAHGYQKDRVMTLIDPYNDPLGKGFHIIQSTIAIGSGGLLGKGFREGTQAQGEFIPERTTDFIFAVYSEEFGLLGALVLLAVLSALILRILVIANDASTLFSRLVAAAMAMIFFVYAFVNMGMVSGILPVVGVPLPFVSYGGTAMMTLGIAIGIVMSVARQTRQARR
jgi:rod shape determining protein RodA